MPGFRLRLGLYQEPRMELRQELRVVQALQLRHALLLNDEAPFNEQTEALQKIKKDLEKGVYSSADQFFERVGKRVKEKDRTNSNKKLIESLRQLGSISRKHELPLDLRDILGTVDIGLIHGTHMLSPSELFKTMSFIIRETKQPLSNVFNTADKIFSGGVNVVDLYQAILCSSKKTKGEYPIGKMYKEISDRVDVHPNKIGVFSNIILDVMKIPKEYSSFHVNTFFSLMDQVIELALPHDPIYKEIPAGDFLSRNDLESILESYPNIPLPILASISVIDADRETLKRLDELAATKPMRKSIDTKRAYLSSIVTISKSYRLGRRAIKDILLKSDGVRQAREILTKFSSLCVLGFTKYKFKLDNGETILSYLHKMKTYDNLVLNQLEEETLNSFEKIISGQLQNPHLFSFRPILSLGRIYGNQSPEEIKLLADITEALVNDRFKEFRYTGEKSDLQLAILGGNIDSWKENTSERRIIGDLKGIEPHYCAVVKIAEGLLSKFERTFGEKATSEYIESLSTRKAELSSQIHQKSAFREDVPQLIEELEILTAKLDYVSVAYTLANMKLEEFPLASKIIYGKLNSKSNDDFRTDIITIGDILNAKKMQNVRCVSIRETDDPDLMFDIGCTPVKSCQRWTEKTSYNDCLPAYIADPNKRLVQAIDERSQVRVRSIVRLLDVNDIDAPILFVERPYADVLSDDIYKVVLGAVIKKAYKMSGETGQQVAVASKDEDYKLLLSELAGELDIEYDTMNFNARFQNSRNTFEYSDAFGGKIKQGTVCKANDVGYIILNHEDN